MAASKKSNIGKDDKSLNFAIKLIDMLLDGELDNTMAKK